MPISPRVLTILVDINKLIDKQVDIFSDISYNDLSLTEEPDLTKEDPI